MSSCACNRGRGPAVDTPRRLGHDRRRPVRLSCIAGHRRFSFFCLDLMEIVFLIALIVLNGLFAMSEIALVTARRARLARLAERSEEHTSELQSRENLVCRLLLEKKKLVIRS